MSFPFGELPAELRLEVYKNLLPARRVYVHYEDILPSGKAASFKGIPLACTCRQIQNEILQLLIREKLLAFSLPCSRAFESRGSALPRSIALFSYIQAVYETVSLSEKDRVAFVECDHLALHRNPPLEFAGHAPAVKQWWFAIPTNNWPRPPRRGETEDYYRLRSADRDATEYRLVEEVIQNTGHQLRPKGLFFGIAHTPYSSRWRFEEGGPRGGWEISGCYQEGAQAR
ncbi:hypothetical protein EV356DRAFT_507140 [Viridothelium virens]|uniref:Uncharacterized protein n=1 Tax=Viridothelium virens TaxID=1048519 RepID=A0A6A6GZW6_VIRVR|nr:hypothetical protein EV356DRAFT_507140 [Viridothelium virens]